MLAHTSGGIVSKNAVEKAKADYEKIEKQATTLKLLGPLP